MCSLIALVAIMAIANASPLALPQAVTSKISPPGPAPSACTVTHPDQFGIVALPMGGIKAHGNPNGPIEYTPHGEVRIGGQAVMMKRGGPITVIGDGQPQAPTLGPVVPMSFGSSLPTSYGSATPKSYGGVPLSMSFVYPLPMLSGTSSPVSAIPVPPTARLPSGVGSRPLVYPDHVTASPQGPSGVVSRPPLPSRLNAGPAPSYGSTVPSFSTYGTATPSSPTYGSATASASTYTLDAFSMPSYGVSSAGSTSSMHLGTIPGIGLSVATAPIVSVIIDGQPQAPTSASHLARDASVQLSGASTEKFEYVACDQESVLKVTLTDGILRDSPKNRTAYIASNRQLQFDSPPQAGAVITAGFSMCSNGSLALGSTAVFWQCLSGNFYNLYDRNWAPQCSPIALSRVRIMSCA